MDPSDNVYQHKTKLLSESESYLRERVLQLEHELNQLRRSQSQIDHSSTAHSIDGLDLLILRADSNQVIQYVNSAFVRYIKVGKDDLLGQPLHLLSQFFSQEMFELLISTPEGIFQSEVRDDKRGKILKVKISDRDGIHDVVIQDVTDSAIFKHYAQKYIPTDWDQLSEDDLDSFLYPEKRLMTVSFTDLRGFTSLSEKMRPEEVRTMVNNYLDEVIDAVEMNHGTVDKIIGDEVMALYGAPIYFADHALRSIKTACDTMIKVKALQETFQELGQYLPDCGIGINTGEMMVGNIGSSNRQNYTVIGSSVNVASRLCEVARGGEVLLTEMTFQTALTQLPEGWEVVESSSEKSEDFTYLEARGSRYYPLPLDRKNKVYLVGPHVASDIQNCELCFRYLYQLQVRGMEQSIVVLSVFNPSGQSNISLNDGRIVENKAERIFGKYRLLERINRGGMGEVWKAKDNFGNIVAIKILIAGESATENQIKRFRREAETMAKLFHRSICRIFEVGEVDHVSYIAMEYIDGVSLAQLLSSSDEQASDISSYNGQIDLPGLIEEVKSTVRSDSASSSQAEKGEKGEKKGRVEPEPEIEGESSKCRILPREQIIGIMMRLCSAVQYAHSHGILHRDLKPSNVMIRSNGEPVVMDFGLAKMQTDPGDLSMSISGQILGTVDFMAPEQSLSSKDVEEMADVYSLGAILYQMATGKKHFYSSGNILTDAQRLQSHVPSKPSFYNPHIEGDFEVIILKSLRPDPKERYRNVTALRNDLEHYQNGEIISAKPVTLIEIITKMIMRNKALSAVILSSCTLSVIAIGWSLINANEKRIEAELARDELKTALVKLETANTNIEEARKEALANLQKVLDLEKAKKRQVALSEKALKALADELLTEAKTQSSGGNVRKAIELTQKAVEQTPQYALAWYELGRYRQQLEEHREAIVSFKKGIPFAQHKKKFQKAIQESEKWIQLEKTILGQYIKLKSQKKPVSQNIAEKAGDAYRSEKRFSNAVEAYRTALAGNNSFNPKIRMKQFHAEAQMLSKDYHPKQTKFTVKNGRIFSLILTKSPITQLPYIGDLSLHTLGVRDMAIKDFSSLTGVDVTHLDLSKSNIKDLVVLNGVAFRSLDISHTQVASLKPLKDRELRALNVTGTKIKTLKEISKIKLKHLYASNTGVSDLVPLKGMPLEVLYLNGAKISDIEALFSMPLVELQIAWTSVEDLSPIQYSVIKRLNISKTQVTELDAIKDLELEHLFLAKTSIRDISPVAKQGLQRLNIKETLIHDVSPLKNCRLKSLSFTPENIKYGMHRLKQLKTLETIEAGKKKMKAADFWKDWEKQKR